MYSLDGLLADEDTEYWQFGFGLPADPAELTQKIDLYQSACARTADEGTRPFDDVPGLRRGA